MVCVYHEVSTHRISLAKFFQPLLPSTLISLINTMAQMIHGFIILFTLFLLVIAVTMSRTFAEQPEKGEGEDEGEGLTLELIHRYSIHSPLYSPNLTMAEKIKQLVKISDRRSFEIGLLLANRSRVMGVRPVMGHDMWVYMVKLGIGTPPTFTNLDFDTGSSLSWTQCAPCSRQFVQKPPLYWAARSSTCRSLPCHHPLCAGLPCIKKQCRYDVTYAALQRAFSRLRPSKCLLPACSKN